MAVTKNKPVNPALNALSVAALALPGLVAAPAYAEDSEVDFQYSHYQEGARNLFGASSAFAPIEVNSLNTSARVKLADRVKFAFNYIQDTWGGATPVATAPLAFGGNSRYTGVGAVSGASPYLNTNNVSFDRNLNPLSKDASGNLVKNTQLVHTLSQASPETRKQGDFKLGYEWDEAELAAGGGISIENDYESRFGNLSGRWDFNQKLTSANAALSYTNSDTQATIDHDAQPYIYDTSAGGASYNAAYSDSEITIGSNGQRTLFGKREDWAANIGLTQIINKNALVTAGVGFTRSTGYLENPYKVVQVAFVDPSQTGSVLNGTVTSLLEQRPNERNQWNGTLGYVQHLDYFDAALHFNYKLFNDDWGITAHTFEADWAQPFEGGWTVTPRVRYYSQEAADFYQPYLVSNQAFSSNAVDSLGREVYVSASNNDGKEYYKTTQGYVDKDTGHVLSFLERIKVNPTNKKVPFDRNKLPKNYSSDHRLSGYGALSGGLTVAKKFAKGITLEAGGEYYSHAGDLKLGGGGEGSYADFDYWLVNANLKVDLAAIKFSGGGHSDHHHGGHAHHHGAHAPAGVMFDHVLPNAGDFMVGYRYMYSSQSGNILHHENEASDQAILNRGCRGNACYVAPSEMTMHMHMFDLMYAPTDWLTLMLMPQLMDMGMSIRGLDGTTTPTDANVQAAVMHSQHHHATGGIGDTGMYALFKLFNYGNHHLIASLGLSAPTGDVGIKLRRTHGVDIGYYHYGMQLGSGTWDFKPSLTYTGQWESLSWGAQLSGTKRIDDKNESGFAFGDIFQATAWSSYALNPWLSASVRSVYTDQNKNKYRYNNTYYPIGPMDYSSSYGGRFVDVGFGVSVTIPQGDLQGNRFSVEWLEPVVDDVNGYQLPRDGTLAANWSVAF
ncbi:hypothetical protein JCM14076_14840 [Methylosoma difficile]